MKLNRRCLKKYKLLKFYFLKYQIYLKDVKDLNTQINLTLDNIEIYFKKSLKLIYEYHSKKKHILFIGFSFPKDKILFNVINNTSHRFISDNMWMNGLLSNRKLDKLNTNVQINHKTISPDLIVIFNSKHKEKIINESASLKIPIIVFNEIVTNNIKKVTYSVPGNYKKISNLNIYSLLLLSILKTKQKNLNSFLPEILLKKKINKRKILFQQSKYRNVKKRYNDYKKR